MSDRVFGIHPVLVTLQSARRSVTRVVISGSRHDSRVRQIVEAARQAGIPVQRQPDRALDRLAGGETHQGVVAFVAGTAYADPDALVDTAGPSALFIVLDGVEDPRNLGAVVRTAAAAGAQGLFLPEHGAAGLTPVAVKASAGAAERLPVARVTNVVALLKSLKDRGVWIVGLDPAGESTWTSFDLTCPVALVLGGEGKGLRRLARQTCDVVLTIPLAPGVESLNLSVAAGIGLFEVVRQRRAGPGKKLS
ncbi:MAG: 23S rRNA (guanosine(2251)-2'-O)-methyltransferase RlmB [Acidobacteria bacterium]|nr:MAG: 23S rRNA (guanosine(2251)-2'-O)-methyltransferase RlmB [Acidobacteriota bacterium]